MENKENLSLIGAIGGLGPQAGLDFVGKIFANTKAQRDQDHLNCMLISCPSIIPDRTQFLLENNEQSENPAFGMFESARRLHLAGVRFAVVACNTAHAGRIFAQFCSMVKESLPGLSIINMLETCAIHVKESMNVTRLGLLATKGTHKSGVYHEYFKTEDGFQLMEPGADGQEKIHEAIFNKDYGIKAHSQQITSRAKELINGEIKLLTEKGAEAVILGCTELPLAIPAKSLAVPDIDPGLIAARKLISLVAPEKLLSIQN